MRVESTPESVENGEISLLAIVETILATGVVIYLSMKFNSYKWIAWSACIAPFLLLRTEESTDFGIELFDKVTNWITSKVDELNKADTGLLRALLNLFCIAALSWFNIGILPILVRFVSIVVTVFGHPLASFSSIPRNWVRATMLIDYTVPSEVVPGYCLKGGDEEFKNIGWVKFFLDDRLDRTFIGPYLVIIYYLPSLIVFSVLPQLYRWAMKATAIIYAPLLWVVSATISNVSEVGSERKRIRERDLTRIVVFYSTLVIIGFALKLIFMMTWGNFVAWWNTTPLTEFLAVYVMPAEIPIWQLAAFMNAIWVIGIFVFVKEASLRIETGEPWSNNIVEAFLRYSWFGRCILSLYVIVCTGYLTVQAASS